MFPLKSLKYSLLETNLTQSGRIRRQRVCKVVFVICVCFCYLVHIVQYQLSTDGYVYLGMVFVYEHLTINGEGRGIYLLNGSG